MSSTAPGDPGSPSTHNRARTKKRRTACTRCHLLKIKCSGETPCRSCKNSLNRARCIYPVKDRKVEVSEQYLKAILAENNKLKQQAAHSSSGEAASTPQAPSEPDDQGVILMTELDDMAESNVANPLFEESYVGFVDEGDMSKRKYVGEAGTTTFERRIHQMVNGVQTSGVGSLYFKDQGLLRVGSPKYQLPNRTYAILLVRTLLHFIGPNYHLMTEMSFLKKLDETYAGQHLEPVWLARLFVIFALGELYLKKTPTSSNGATVPGTHFFLQATALFPDLYEEVDLAYIETLVGMALFSNALNRTRSAHAMLGLALRLCLTLGLHRNDMHDERMTPVERERRHRVWWTVYTFDRLGCSKAGQPALIRDEDIDTPLPSEADLTDSEKKEFMKPDSLVAKVKLAEITGSILDLIYCAPRARTKGHFVRNVQTILTRLRAWDEKLPAHLKFDNSVSPPYRSRPVASLHAHFYDCIIITTRPVLLHVLKKRIHRTENTNPAEQQPQEQSLMTSALSDACVQSARSSLRLLAQLWIEGSIATYGYFDSSYIFSSVIVLSIWNFLQENQEDQELIETAWDLLRMMKSAGNVPASEFLERLGRLTSNIEELKTDRHQDGTKKTPYSYYNSNTTTEISNQPTASHVSQQSSSVAGNITLPITSHPLRAGPLDDSLMQGFLTESENQWNVDILGMTEEMPFPWMHDLDVMNSFDLNMYPDL